MAVPYRAVSPKVDKISYTFPYLEVTPLHGLSTSDFSQLTAASLSATSQSCCAADVEAIKAGEIIIQRSCLGLLRYCTTTKHMEMILRE